MTVTRGATQWRAHHARWGDTATPAMRRVPSRRYGGPIERGRLVLVLPSRARRTAVGYRG